MKKIRLRRWVKVVLKFIFWINIFLLVCDHEDNLILFMKTIICMLFAGVSGIILLTYGGYDE